MLNPIFKMKKEVETLNLEITSFYQSCHYKQCIKSCQLLANLQTQKNQTVYLHLGKCHRQLGDLLKAKEYLLFCAQEFPECSECFLQLAEIAQIEEQHHQALMYFDVYQTLLSQNQQGKEDDKEVISNNNKKQKKSNTKSNITSTSSSHCALLGKIAESHIAVNDYTKAGQIISQILTLNPSSKIALLLQGDLHMLNNNLEEAETTYLDCLRTNPQSIPASYKLGRLYEKQEKYTEAIEQFQLCIALDNKFALSYLQIAMILAKEPMKLEQSLVYYEKYINLLQTQQSDQNSLEISRIYMIIGQILEEQLFRSSDALEVYFKANVANPNDITPLLRIGDIYFTKNKFQEASEIYEKIIRIHPKSKIGFIKLGKCLMNLEKYERSIAVYKNELLLDAYNSETFAAIAGGYEKLKDSKQADEFYRLSLQINPYDQDVKDLYQTFLEKQSTEEMKK